MVEVRGRRGFVPVVALGVATGGLAALAGNRPWVEAEPQGAADTGYTPASGMEPTADAPLVGALALVLLATWGVVLVTRGRVRRAMAVVAVLAALGVLGAGVVAALTLPSELSREYAALAGGGAVETSYTPWFVLAVVAAPATVVPAVLAVRWVPAWPEMGSRYDAPTAASGEGGASGTAAEEDLPTEDQRHLDLWRAIEEGRDPTD